MREGERSSNFRQNTVKMAAWEGLEAIEIVVGSRSDGEVGLLCLRKHEALSRFVNSGTTTEKENRRAGTNLEF